MSGVNTTLWVIAHELPQEIGDFMVLKMWGFKVKTLLFWNFVVANSVVLGVFVSDMITNITKVQEVQKTMIAITAGSFCSLSLYLIMPQVLDSIDWYIWDCVGYEKVKNNDA